MSDTKTSVDPFEEGCPNIRVLACILEASSRKDLFSSLALYKELLELREADKDKDAGEETEFYMEERKYRAEDIRAELSIFIQEDTAAYVWWLSDEVAPIRDRAIADMRGDFMILMEIYVTEDLQTAQEKEFISSRIYTEIIIAKYHHMVTDAQLLMIFRWQNFHKLTHDDVDLLYTWLWVDGDCAYDPYWSDELSTELIAELNFMYGSWERGCKRYPNCVPR